MGLWGQETDWALPDQLPPLPETEPPLEDLRVELLYWPEAPCCEALQHRETRPERVEPRGKSSTGYEPVITPNGSALPWILKDGVKEFHLVAEPVVREFAPGMEVKCWGYNGQAPEPTIECVEGDRVRLLVTHKLPEHTTIHWHGIFLPSGMDGVGGLSQPHIKPGETYAYEFTLRQHGTFMYHPHADEMVQMAVGMMGMFRWGCSSFIRASSRGRPSTGTSPNLMGVAQGAMGDGQDLEAKIRAMLPGYMDMGESGMAEHAQHAKHMSGPKNTLPMMMGEGPFGPLEMGGMFTVLKVRDDLTSYEDPGWYDNPPGTVAYKVE